jgi:hypothetical protein
MYFVVDFASCGRGSESASERENMYKPMHRLWLFRLDLLVAAWHVLDTSSLAKNSSMCASVPLTPVSDHVFLGAPPGTSAERGCSRNVPSIPSMAIDFWALRSAFLFPMSAPDGCQTKCRDISLTPKPELNIH